MTQAILARLRKIEDRLALRVRTHVFPIWQNETQEVVRARIPKNLVGKTDLVVFVQRFSPREAESMDRKMDSKQATLQ